MKRFRAFVLAMLILFMCTACKKTLPATQPGSAQTAAGETEQTVSGVSVRIPAAQYRLARTEPEGMTVGTALLPYSGGAVLTGSMITGSADEPLRTEAAAYYTPEHACTVQELPISPDGLAVQAALAGGVAVLHRIASDSGRRTVAAPRRRTDARAGRSPVRRFQSDRHGGAG